jgi:hypothetical protein
MAKVPILKSKQLIRVLEKLGFLKHHQEGIINDLDLTIEEFIKIFKL